MAPEAIAGCVTRRLVAGCLAASCCFAFACSRAARDVNVSWTIDPNPPIAGTATAVQIMLADGSGVPIRGATLQLEAHMSHPGMAPVTAHVVDRQNGSYDSRLVLSMPGDWVFVVNGALPDGRRIARELAVAGK
jgi:hypothetical protein